MLNRLDFGKGGCREGLVTGRLVVETFLSVEMFGFRNVWVLKSLGVETFGCRNVWVSKRLGIGKGWSEFSGRGLNCRPAAHICACVHPHALHTHGLRKCGGVSCGMHVRGRSAIVISRTAACTCMRTFFEVGGGLPLWCDYALSPLGSWRI